MKEKIRDYIGLHYDFYGFWVETDLAKDREEAYSIMERNDDNLLVLNIREAKKLAKVLEEVLEGIELQKKYNIKIFRGYRGWTIEGEKDIFPTLKQVKEFLERS
jgi:hypothetical protein